MECKSLRDYDGEMVIQRINRYIMECKYYISHIRQWDI